MFNLEKRTKGILSVVILVVALAYIFVGFGRSDLLVYTNVALATVFGLFIFSETGAFDYFRSKGYKTLNINDVWVWAGFVLGTLVILGGLATFTIVRDILPDTVLNFLSVYGAIVGGFAGLYAIALLWFGKPQN